MQRTTLALGAAAVTALSLTAGMTYAQSRSGEQARPATEKCYGVSLAGRALDKASSRCR